MAMSVLGEIISTPSAAEIHIVDLNSQSPSLTPQYMDMPNYAISPISPVSQVAISSQTQGMTIQRQRHGPPPLSARPSISRTQTSSSPISSDQSFVTVQQPRRKQDRERRKAQNRASQRAYRERKEVQLRDLAASLKSIEAAMAVVKIENGQLRARLGKMKKNLEVLSKENEGLMRIDKREEGSRMQNMVVNSAHTGMARGEPTPPLFDECYESRTRSNTVSVVGTPKNLKREELAWNGMSLDLKEMPIMGPGMAEEGTGEGLW